MRESVEQQRSLDIEGRFQQFDESISSIREDVAASNQQLRQLPALVDEIRATVTTTIEREVQKQVSEHLPRLLRGMLESAAREQIVQAVQPVLQSVLPETANEMLTDNDALSKAQHDDQLEDEAGTQPHEDAEMTEQSTPTTSEGVENDDSDRPEEDAASSISRHSQHRSSTIPQPVDAAAPTEQSAKVISGISSYVQRAQELVDTQSVNSFAEHRSSTPPPSLSPHRAPSSSPPPLPTTTPPPMPASEVPTTMLSALTPLPSTILSTSVDASTNLTPAAMKEATISTLSVFANAPTSSAPSTQLAQYGFGDSISAILSHYDDSPAPSQDETKE